MTHKLMSCLESEVHLAQLEAHESDEAMMIIKWIRQMEQFSGVYTGCRTRLWNILIRSTPLDKLTEETETLLQSVVRYVLVAYMDDTEFIASLISLANILAKSCQRCHNGNIYLLVIVHSLLHMHIGFFLCVS